MKEIKGYEDSYYVTKSGDVFSKDRIKIDKNGVRKRLKGKKLSCTINKVTNYHQACLWKNNKQKMFAVHRLVAQHFIPNPEHKPEVNHKDSDRTNNAVYNLEWVTSAENSNHAYTEGYATQKPRRRLVESDYLIIFERFLLGESFEKIMQDFTISAGRLSVNLRALVSKWGRDEEYNQQLKSQRLIRLKSNGAQYAD